MFAKVLVANRGEIACRILRTLHRLDVASVAVYSEPDRASPHVDDAGEAILVDGDSPLAAYLDADRIVAAARSVGADAIHPGYGFLSERAEFAEACAAAGITFIGPTPVQLRAFGTKHGARALAEQHSVPLLPGTDVLPDAEAAVYAAEAIGYPVMLKSTAGGGGIGMRRCDGPDELAEAYTAVERLAAAHFGTGGVLLERFVVRARHLEVQIFGDGHDVVALGERDCSVQRRNQKVVEETPAPGITDEERAELADAAVRLGRAVGYRSAGTVEFVHDCDREEFSFLEVNTRLQVEHGVTEAVTGVDLVEWMVLEAAGELDLARAVPTVRSQAPAGHAIEVRLYAEDPANDFRPSTGELTDVAFPAEVRCDTWVGRGTEVTPYFDPLLAKLVVHGTTRAEAVARAAHCARGHPARRPRDQPRVPAWCRVRPGLRRAGAARPGTSPDCGTRRARSRCSTAGPRPACRSTPGASATGRWVSRPRARWTISRSGSPTGSPGTLPGPPRSN